ncbi:ImmA/IrrE family metallo-endopeptidase [Amycolatopsis sp. RTGN1]|uniref:ImmA/IrrE family metallo-endopeptidase n=1 Tax=Amycolatopsis ponsaeliensis TaxID=2992142 RepID=UPI00254E05AA|nr:ImmA/IrrE family metallo-endopeptidase [Amycolatopsis sp. RTGN1]
MVSEIGGIQPVGDLRELIESFGVPVIFAEMPDRIHGITVHEDFDGIWRGVVVVNCRDSWTRQRFTLAHELAHIIYRDSQPIIIDDDQEVDESNRVEFRAECFARYFLVPAEGLSKSLLNVDGVESAAMVANTMLHFGVSRPAAMRALAESTQMSYEYLNGMAGAGSVRDLMARSRLDVEWSTLSRDQHDESASPWLLELALDAYREKYVPAQLVADVLGRGDETDSVEADLVAQGWAH